MKSIFLDTNVVIDFLAGRQPFSADAAQLLDGAARGEVKIYVSAVSYNNIYYIIRRSVAHHVAMALLENLSEITEIADVSAAVVLQSLKADFKDYENAIQYHSALTVPEISVIVTRNEKDFKKSALPVLNPREAIAFLKN